MNEKLDTAEIIGAEESKKDFDNAVRLLKKYAYKRSYPFSHFLSDSYEESRQHEYTEKSGQGMTSVSLVANRLRDSDLSYIDFTISSTIGRQIDELPPHFSARIDAHEELYPDNESDIEGNHDFSDGYTFDDRDGIYMYETIRYSVSEFERSATQTSMTSYVIDGDCKFVVSTDSEETYSFEDDFWQNDEDSDNIDNVSKVEEIDNHETDVNTLLFSDRQIASIKKLDSEMFTSKEIGRRVMNIIAILDGKALFI